MFMRFIQLKIAHEYIEEFKQFYEKVIFAKLQKTPGCLFAGLISSAEVDEFISLTFWQTIKQAEDYEKIGEFKNLFNETKPYLSESTEWKINLSDKMELEYTRVDDEPVIKKYSVKAQKNQNENFSLTNSNMFVRIVSARIQDDKVEEFKNLYNEIIIPELKAVKGCQYAYLIESIYEENDFISLTIWDNKKDAENYEKSGKFLELVRKVEHTFSQFYLWKMSLEKDYNAKVQTTEDLKISQYNLVFGKNII